MNTKRFFWGFNEARNFVRGLGLRTRSEWSTYCKSGQKPEYIPVTPDKVYAKHGWSGWTDWLVCPQYSGTVPATPSKFRSFEDAREFVKGLGLQNVVEWGEFLRSGTRPTDLPAAPYLVYRDTGWSGFGDWLGVETVANRGKAFLSFEVARDWVREQGLSTRAAWEQFCASGWRPTGIPASPHQAYGESWQGWSDWLGINKDGI